MFYKIVYYIFNKTKNKISDNILWTSIKQYMFLIICAPTNTCVYSSMIYGKG